MEKLQEVSKEVWLIIFYSAYILFSKLICGAIPSGPVTPGPGYLTYVALIPLTLAIFVYHFIQFLKNNNAYWKCLIIDLLVWPIIILLAKCNLL